MKFAKEDSIRFWSHVKAPVNIIECWIWQGSKNNQGYGGISFKGKALLAHRCAFEVVFGEIPKGRVIDHLCRNRLCVNPYHMQVTTQKENVHRGNALTGINSRKTHCKRGHALTGNNIQRSAYIKFGYRICRICDLDGQRRRWHARKKE